MADMEPDSFLWIANPAFRIPQSIFFDAEIGFPLLSQPKLMTGLEPHPAWNSSSRISSSITSPMSR